MNWRKWGTALLLAAAAASNSAFAHRGGSHLDLGFFIGPGWGYYGPAYPYSYPYYPAYPVYVPPPVVVQSPPVYLEQSPAPAPTAGYWYYCDRPEGYYPYVKECPGGWQRVAPQPAR